MAVVHQEEKPLILLIEDNQDQAYVLSYYLRNCGYSVDWCNTPGIALNSARQKNYDLILLDVFLNAEEDGFDLCKQFKSDSELKSIPIIMVTARNSAADRVSGLKLGADDYITKPFSREELVARIEAVIKRKEYFETTKRYRDLIENTDDIVIFLDTDGIIEHANRHAEFLLPDYEDSLGKVKFQDLFDTIYSKSIAVLLRRVLEGHEASGNSWKLRKSRLSISTIDCKLLPIRRGEKVIGIGCILRDATPREKVFQALEQNTKVLREEVQHSSALLNEMQQKLVMSEKMAVMGQLAAGIAHELRNPLNTIGSSTYYLKRVLNSENTKVQEHLDIINQEIRRSQSIITNLLDFARKSPVDRSSVNINKILDQTLALVRKELSNKSIELVKEFSEVKPCYVNSDDMKQVFLNLILNSNNAMPNGGILTVKTRMNDNETVVVEFTDSGQGIEEKYLNKIFDPFFTTNKDGNGIGIGLSIVHSAIDRNKGNISVASQVGVGTTFQLELPVYVEEN